MLLEPLESLGKFDPRPTCCGTCPQCGRMHGLPLGYALDPAKALLRTLAEKKRIDLAVAESEADPLFSTDYLYGDARGQMFGVLVCRDKAGRTGVLKAFSGQYNGQWLVDGWVPPLVDVDELEAISRDTERAIKDIGARLVSLEEDCDEFRRLIVERREMSQGLMKKIHSLYSIPNFRGDETPLPEVTHGDGGIPTGTGDCCAPKLFGYAARNGLTPLGLAEFYFGRENKSGTRRHGAIYASCQEKCGRILGYMLCGLGEK